MPLNVNFTHWKVQELKEFLQDRGISCSLHRKLDLLRLCELANELDLEVLRSDDDYEVMDRNRRTIQADGEEETIVLPKVTEIKEFRKNLRTLPSVEYCDILIYLLQYCKWNEDRMKQYRNDKGFRLYLANHIDEVQISLPINVHYLYVKATCVPETRQSAVPYSVWILLRESGEVISGGCTCVAYSTHAATASLRCSNNLNYKVKKDNGTCKHCVALLFALTSFCDRHKDRGTEVGTDVECVWDKPRQESTPMEIENIDIRIDTNLPPPITPTHNNYQPQVKNLPPQLETARQFKQLCKGTNALLLQTLYTDSDESDSEVTSVPTMSDVVKSCTSDTSLMDELLNAFDKDTIQTIEEETRGQSENPEWFIHRKGRITASNFFSVMHFRYTDCDENYISRQIMGKSTVISSPSVSFGRANEPIARHLYFDKYQKEHYKASINLCGLFVDPQYPYLGASPDGIVACHCCGEGLIEIKCSYMYQNSTPQEACLDHHYHVYIDENDNVRLKVGSSWYVQIQGQLGVCGKKWCDFILYTKKGFIVERIYFDEEMFSQIVQASGKFFEKYIIKALKQE